MDSRIGVTMNSFLNVPVILTPRHISSSHLAVVQPRRYFFSFSLSLSLSVRSSTLAIFLGETCRSCCASPRGSKGKVGILVKSRLLQPFNEKNRLWSVEDGGHACDTYSLRGATFSPLSRFSRKIRKNVGEKNFIEKWK